MNKTNISLEPYKGRSTRHECPACHSKHSFTRYIDGDTGVAIYKDCGRCDHETGCGYHYTPKEYYQDNPGSNDGRVFTFTRKCEQFSPKTPGRIPKQYLIRSLGYDSNLVAFLCSLFDRYTLESPTIERLMADYYLGCTKDKGVIFWQIDERNRIRTGKIMAYSPTTGKRLKNADGSIDWTHAKLKRDKVLPDDFNLVQCLFGEHLLKRYPDKVVALVESEKSVLIGSGVFPDYLWLATGGRSQLSHDKLRVLKGRTVVLFPDADAFDLWREKPALLESIGARVMVSDLIEKNATQADKDAKIDIADWLIRQLQASIPESQTSVEDRTKLKSENAPATDEERALKHLGNLNPNIYTLIDTLGLVSASTGEKPQTHIN